MRRAYYSALVVLGGNVSLTWRGGLTSISGWQDSSFCALQFEFLANSLQYLGNS